MKSKMNKKNNFISPNPEITAEYDDLIANNPNEFIAKLNAKTIKTTCLSPMHQKFIKKVVKKQNRQASKEAIKILWVFLKNYKMSMFWMILVTILSTALMCVAIFGLQQLTQLMPILANSKGDIYQHNVDVLLYYGFILLGFYFLSAIMTWLQTRIMTIISQKVGYKIREQLFSKIQKLPVKYFDQNSSGDLMSKFTNDINNVTNALSQNVVLILNGFFMVFSMLLCMFLMSPYLALITIGLVPFMFLPMMLVIRKSQPLFKYTQIAIGKLNGFIEEMISGQSVINLFDQSKKVNDEFKKINDELQKFSRKSQGSTAVMFPYANFFANILIMIITVIGIIFIVNNIEFTGVKIPEPFGIQTPPPFPISIMPNDNILYIYSSMATIASFTVMTRSFLMPFAQIANVVNMLQAALAGANRAFSVFDENDEINEFEHIILNIASNTTTYRHQANLTKIINNNEINQNSISKKDKLDHIHLDEKMIVKPNKPFEEVTTNGSILVKNLNFNYVPNKQILFDINIDAKEGQKVAIVGPTGSGKSTFINLLTKFYDIKHGDLLIGGDVSIKEITKYSMRQNVSIVLQDTFLFNISIRDNIKCGRLDATDDEVINAAKIANAHSFIMQLPNGYDTILEDNGDSLSQGQRQLLAIARAILVKSSLLILDEATSSIDSKTEIEIQNAMLRLMENKTSFIIAHRLSTIENADQILVLKDGCIIERGTHSKLLEMKGFYYNLYNSQFFEEE